MRKIKLIIATLILSILSISCGVTACECATILKDKTAEMDASYNRAYENGTNADFDNQKWIGKGRRCMEEFTDKNPTEIQNIQTFEFVSMEAIANAEKECNTKQDFTQSQIDIACDCWNQSVQKSGKAFDDMNSAEQDFRKKCNDAFDGDERSMKNACKNAK
jgi:hypothetical protein